MNGSGRVREALAAASFALLGLALAAGMALTLAAVRAAEDQLLKAEATSGVELWARAGDDALQSFIPGRFETTRRVRAGLDRPVIENGLAHAALYDADGWEVLGTLTVMPRGGDGRSVPAWLVALAVLSSLLLLAAARLWTAPSSRWPGAVTAALALATAFGPALAWAHTRLVAATDARLALAAAALEAAQVPSAVAPDEVGPIRRGAVARLTGLPLLLRRPDGTVAATTLMPPTAAALAAPSSPPPRRLDLGSVPWALADHGPYRLAMAPLEQTRGPLAAVLAVALAGLLLAGLPVVLVPLADAPRAMRRNLRAWGFLAPAASHLAVFTLGPLAFSAWLSLHRWNLVDAARPFVGLDNYAALASDAGFWGAMANTALFTLHVPVAMTVALGFALLVHRRTRTLLAVRAALFLPSITSLVAIAVVWQWILNDDYGILNWLLGLVGLGPVRWLTSPSTALVSVMLLSTWMVVGYQMVIFQAGLSAIPKELYEAARIDGAGAWQRFRYVTLPGLRHTLFFVLVTSVIGSFQIFGAVYVMTEGGPLGATDVAVYHIYKEAWEFLHFGDAAAQSWVLFAVIFAVTWLHFRLLEQRAEGAGARARAAMGQGVAR
jgi:multiple sugar transport system permease protein